MNSSKIKKILNWGIALAAGAAAVIETILDQKKEERIEQMDKRIKLLEDSKKGE